MKHFLLIAYFLEKKRKSKFNINSHETTLKVYRLITKPSDRIQPKCGVCTACGECQLQQLSYDAQLEYKKNKIEDDFIVMI